MVACIGLGEADVVVLSGAERDQLQCRDQRMQQTPGVEAGLEIVVGDMAPSSRAQRDLL